MVEGGEEINYHTDLVKYVMCIFNISLLFNFWRRTHIRLGFVP